MGEEYSAEKIELIGGEYGVKILNIKTREVEAFIDYSSDAIRFPSLLNKHISNILFSNDGNLLFVKRQDHWSKPCWVEVFHLVYSRESK